MYVVQGSSVYFEHRSGERDLRANCADQSTANRAVDLLNRADHHNNVKRQYTAAARLIAQAESLVGFAWDDGVDDIRTPPQR